MIRELVMWLQSSEATNDKEPIQFAFIGLVIVCRDVVYAKVFSKRKGLRPPTGGLGRLTLPEYWRLWRIRRGGAEPSLSGTG